MEKKTGVELEFSILDSDFRKAIADMNSSLSSMRKELTLENETLKGSSTSVNDYQSKLNTLKQQQEVSKNKVEEAAAAYEKVKKLFGENSKEANKYKDTLITAQTEQQRITNTIEKTTTSLEEYKSSLKENERKSLELNSALGVLNSTITDQKTDLEELKKQYINTVLEQGKGSTQAQELKGKIKNLSNEIADSESRLNDASKELKDFTTAEDQAGKNAITFGEMIKANLISEGIKKGISSIVSGIKELTNSIIGFAKQGFDSFGDYEQLVGGVDTLFKDSSLKVQEYANNAYKTSGLSANKYMETVTSFSASLLQSLDGDTEKAAKAADMAIVDMSDNANKMGTDMARIQDAYQGFAKQNYTMLDNLKLGYGGTKTEMERLLADAEKLSGQKYDISSLNDVYSAIHVIQGQLGITGTTAKEASITIQGSISSMKSAWSNLIAGLGNENADFKLLTTNLMNSISTVASNAIPIIENIVEGIGFALPEIFEIGGELLNTLLSGLEENIPLITSTIFNVLNGLTTILLSCLPQILQVGITFLVELVRGISQALPQLIPSIVNVILEMVKVLTNPDNLTNIINAALVLISSLGTGLISAIPVLVEKLPEIINNITTFFTENIDQIIDVGIEMIVNLAMALVDSIPVILENLPKIITSIVSGLITILPKLATVGLEMIVKLGTSLVENVPHIVQKIPQIIGSIIGGFGNLVSEALNIGKNFVTGLWDGINNAKDWILEKIGGFKDAVINGIKSFFGIHSPSTLFRDEIGKNLALGLGLGFTNKMVDISKEMQESIPTDFDVAVDTNVSSNVYSSNPTYANRSINDITDYNPGQVVPLYLTIENFNNTREQDVESLAEELGFYLQRSLYGKGTL